MRKLIIAMLAGLLAGCGGGSKYESFDGYEQVPLSATERQSVIQDVQSVIGTRYTWGGDTIDEGFDCSGLIQWAFRQQGFGKFRNGDTVRDEITAHNLYRYNVEQVGSLDDLRQGDFLFFDESGDGHITHNAVFDHVDTEGRVWVYDAYSIEGEVTYRYVQNFWDKGPLFGRPMKTVPK